MIKEKYDSMLEDEQAIPQKVIERERDMWWNNWRNHASKM